VAEQPGLTPPSEWRHRTDRAWGRGRV